jgi:hypothetical protein
MSVFLGALTLVSGTNYKVGRQYFNPPTDYQPTDGMGVTVDGMPVPQPPAGQILANTYVDTSTNMVTYDYIIPPQTTDQQIAALQAQNAQMLLALVNGGLM